MKRIAFVLVVVILMQIFCISGAVNAVSSDKTEVNIINDSMTLEQIKKDCNYIINYAGYYYLEMEYTVKDKMKNTPQMSVSFDNGDASIYDIPRLWTYDISGKRFDKDSFGNEIIPGQKEVKQRQKLRFEIKEETGNASNGINLTKGNHTISIKMVKQTIEIISLKFVLNNDVINNKEYVSENNGESPKNTKFCKVIDAEMIDYKSHPEITVSYDRSTPSVSPNDPVKIKYNIIGGTSYSTPGQWLSWVIDIPEDGFYNINFRYRQNLSQGQIVRRQLFIDDEIPFKECEELLFPYTEKFIDNNINDTDGNEAKFFLSKGKHEIKLKVSLGSLTTSLQALDQVVKELNSLYTKIVVIVGETPDSYRDYDLEKSIDNLIGTLQSSANKIHETAKSFADGKNNNNSNTAQLEQIVRVLNDFVKSPRTLPVHQDIFRSQINTLASLIADLSTQPLELDTVTVKSDKFAEENKKIGFSSIVSFRIKSFLNSFISDYNSINASESDSKPINAWITTNDIATMGFSTGRDQAQIITQMIRNGFYKDTNIPVSVSLMDSGVILQALVSGRGPDVALFVPEVIMSNLYFRKALLDLKEMPDFDKIQKRFYPSAFISLSYNGKVFALPEIQSYNMMFYRTDIFKNNNISVPETWEEFYDVMTKIQKAGMQVGVAESQTIYETFLLQNGGKLYENDLSKTCLTSEMSVNAFKEWTDLYVKKSVPIAFDALNRFRTGQIPLVITSASFYNTLSVGAVEINNLWKMVPIPGIKAEDGSINRTESCKVSGAIVLKNTKNKKNAFRFIDWWTENDTQAAFGSECESRFGITARYFPANIDMLEGMTWSSEEYDSLNIQRKNLSNVPQSPATYFLNRNLTNSFRKVIYSFENARDVIHRYGRETDIELDRKMTELGLKKGESNEKS